MLRLADAWVDYDDAEGSRRSWQVRNRVRSNSPAGWQWLTIPLSGTSHQPIRTMEVDNSTDWQRVHLRTIRSMYAKYAGVSEVADVLGGVFASRPQHLVDITIPLLRVVSARLDLDTKVFTSSELEVEGRKTQRILNLCAHLGADRYLTGPKGLDYLDIAAFDARGVRLEVFDWRSPEPTPDGIPLSIVDLIARHGSKRAAALLTGTGQAVPVHEYLASR